MLERLRLFSRQDKGAAAVEFAIVSSVLFLLVFGAAVYGFYFSVLLAIDHAASEGARASLSEMDASLRTAVAQAEIDRVLDAYGSLIDTSLITTQIGPLSGNPGLFSVSISYQFSATSFGNLGNIVPLPSEEPNVTAIVSNGGY